MAVHTAITDLVYFFRGGLNYTDAVNMPIAEIYDITEQAVRINKEVNKTKGKHGF